MDFAAHPVRLGKMRDLERAGHARLPGNVGAHNIHGVERDGLRDAPGTAARRLRAGNGNIQRGAKLGVFRQFKIAERFFEPVVIQFFQIASDTDGFDPTAVPG